jgi:hypothetical protein
MALASDEVGQRDERPGESTQDVVHGDDADDVRMRIDGRSR